MIKYFEITQGKGQSLIQDNWDIQQKLYKLNIVIVK